MATVTDYEDMRLALIDAFRTAIISRRAADKCEEEGSIYAASEGKLAIDHHVAAFNLAKLHGWDCDRDEEWYLWTLKATEQEILTEGLRLALDRCRPDLCEACEGKGGEFVELQKGFPIWQDCDECS